MENPSSSHPTYPTPFVETMYAWADKTPLLVASGGGVILIPEKHNKKPEMKKLAKLDKSTAF